MKKIAFLISVFSLLIFNSNLSFSQNNDDQIQIIKSKIEKSDRDTANPKKASNYKFWDKRGKIFLEAYEVNIKDLYPGLEAVNIMFLGINENNTTPYYGKPKKKYTEGDFEVWEYDKVKIYINKKGLVEKFVDLKPIDDQALLKAYRAFKKAIELDASGKYVQKKSTIENLFKLRNYLTNAAFDTDDPKLSYRYIKAAIDLFQYPRPKYDTTANVGLFYYYAGYFAAQAKKYDDAEKFFYKSIENKQLIGDSYANLAQIYYIKGDSAKGVEILKEGLKKYPTEEKIIYNLIDYYMPRGEYQEVLNYLDQAIKLNPDFINLYVVKAEALRNISNKLISKYFNILRASDSCKKEAFKNRSKPEIKTKLENCSNEKLEEANKVLEEFKKIEEQEKQTIDKILSIDPNSKDAFIIYALFNDYIAGEYNKYTSSIPPTQSSREKFLKYATETKNYYEKAIENLLKYEKVVPNDKEVVSSISKTYRTLSNICNNLGETDKAKEYSQKSIEYAKKANTM